MFYDPLFFYFHFNFYWCRFVLLTVAGVLGLMRFHNWVVNNMVAMGGPKFDALLFYVLERQTHYNYDCDGEYNAIIILFD